MATRGVSSLSPGSGRRQQPLRATVPFQLRGAEGIREVSVLCSTYGANPGIPQKASRVRRTSSLDTVVDSFLQGPWPRQPDGAEFVNNNKATQTPLPWTGATADGPKMVFHKRSASWSSAEFQCEVAKVKQQLQKSKQKPSSQALCSPVLGDHTLGSPLNSALLCPNSSSVRHQSRSNRSLEDLELEEVFVNNTGQQDFRQILDVPDGHRAPVPQICGSSLFQEMSSHSLSPSTPLCVDQSPSCTVAEGIQNLALEPQHDPLDKDHCSSPVSAAAASPRPNHSYKFQREPPEGCEKVEAYEETLSQNLDPALLHSGPDKNKVHFNPTGSAFCPISLVKPLLPNMDFFLRNFAAGSGFSGHLSSCPIKPHSAFDGSYQEYDHFSEATALRCSPSQASEGSTFHSSLVM